MRVKPSKALQELFTNFLENYPPWQFSATLRSILLEYIRVNLEMGLPVDFDRFLLAIEDLFQLLDAAEEERRQIEKQPGGPPRLYTAGR